jgi:histidinol-phosphate aminotransferase
MLLKVKLSFEPSGVSAAAAVGALEDERFRTISVSSNREQLEYVTQALRALGLNVVPSAANFVMLVNESAAEAQETFQGLLQEGLIVRPLQATGIPQALRISVGTREENARLCSAMSRLRDRIPQHA